MYQSLQPSWTEKLSTVGVVALSLCCLGMQFYAFNKGFDITDEGYNLQLMRSRFVGTSNTYFFEVYRLLFGWLPMEIWYVRLVSTLLIMASNALLVVGAFKYFTIPFKLLYVATAAMAIPLSVSLDPVTFSYNYASAVFALSGVGLCLWGASIPVGRAQRSALLLAGVCISMVLMCKVTTGISLFLGIIGFMLMVYGTNRKSLVWFVSGWFLYQLLHAVCATPVWVQFRLLFAAKNIFIQMDPHYSFYNILYEAWLFTRAQLELILVFAMGWLAFRSFTQWYRWLAVLAMTVYAGYLFSISEYQLTAYITLLFGSFCVAMGTLLFNRWTRFTIQQVKEGIALMLLWSVPLCVSLGTNNHFNYNYVFASSPLLVLGIVLLHRNRIQLKWAQPLLLVLLSVGIGYVCYTKILFQPYRILPLSQQNRLVQDMPILEGIKLDTSTANRFTRLKMLLEKQGFRPNNPVICLGKMQGLVSVLQTSSPGGVMFSPVFKELYLHNLAADTLLYDDPIYIISDAPLYSNHSMFQQEQWGQRFNSVLAGKKKKVMEWIALDSVAFDNTPMGKLYVYRSL